jgi:predicted nucleotidyltransferase
MNIGNDKTDLVRRLPLVQIAEICRKHEVSQLSLCGLGDDLHPEDELLFVVTFHNDDAGPWGSKLDEIEDSLARLLHRKVHVASQRGIEQSSVPPRRDQILGSAVLILDADARGELAITTATTFSRNGVALPLDRIAEICQKNDVVELSVFGSVLRDDFGPDSDVDFMAVFRAADCGPWMARIQQLERGLSTLIGREVDVVTKESVLQSENWIRRNHILDSAQVIYGS